MSKECSFKAIGVKNTSNSQLKAICLLESNKPMNVATVRKGDELSYTSVIIVYKSYSEKWRGFIIPYDITHEGATKKEVISTLKEMLNSYDEGLVKYKYPSHLKALPLSDPEDSQKYTDISKDLMSNLKSKIFKINSKSYYAEAQLPSA